MTEEKVAGVLWVLKAILMMSAKGFDETGLGKGSINVVFWLLGCRPWADSSADYSGRRAQGTAGLPDGRTRAH